MSNTVQKKPKVSGFTLIELLVVIAIIGILASVVLASLETARMQARDAKRLAEIKQLQVALELYYTNNGEYPPFNNGTAQAVFVGNALNELVPNYIPSLPVDPVYGITASGYGYATPMSGANAQQKYTLRFYLEGDDHQRWCTVSVNGGFNDTWNGLTELDTPQESDPLYRDLSHSDCR